jgi:hypothetical protein
MICGTGGQLYKVHEGMRMSLFLPFTNRVCDNVTAVNIAGAVETLVSNTDVE